MNYIYCITNLINNKRYVGKTTLSLNKRFKEHCCDSKRARYSKRPLYDAMNKYGIENFRIDLVEEVNNEEDLSNREIFWIKELGTYGSGGYNASKGGDGIVIYDYNEIVDLANLGYCKQQIADRVGCSLDTVAKVLRAKDVKLRKEYAKIIAQYDLAGNYIQHFYGANDACAWLYKNGCTKSNNCTSHVLKCCNHKIKSYGGYKWEFLPTPL